ncbi:MAG: ArnT family glycosyltransferase [Blastocatellales bacterium]
MAVKETKLTLSVDESSLSFLLKRTRDWLTEPPSDGRPVASELSKTTANTKTDKIVYIIILAVGAFYLITIRSGHDWGDDFSLYIQHAKNIVQGAKYWTTSYLHLPPFVGPDAYPPGYPLMLVPVYKLFGLNLTAMKVEVILLFLLGLVTIHLVCRRELPPHLQIALIALLGFSPYFWEMKDQVVSDLPFLVLAYMSIYLIQQAYRKSPTGVARMGFILAISISIYFSYATRSVGLVLIPSLLVYDLIKHKRPTFFALSVALATCFLVILQSLLLRSDRGYISQFGADNPNFLMNWLRFMFHNATHYPRSLTVLWDNGYSKGARLGLTCIVTAFALAGYTLITLRKLSFLEIFVILYILLIIAAPMDGGVRYLIPIIPLYFYYSMRGVGVIFRKTLWRQRAFYTLAVLIAIAYAGKYTKVDYGALTVSVESSGAHEFFEYIKTNTGENDVIIFTKPRALALFTGRHSSFYPVLAASYSDWWKYFRKIQATHIVTGPAKVEEDEQLYLNQFISTYQSNLAEVYANSGFKVYRIKEYPSSMVTTSQLAK